MVTGKAAAILNVQNLLSGCLPGYFNSRLPGAPSWESKPLSVSVGASTSLRFISVRPPARGESTHSRPPPASEAPARRCRRCSLSSPRARLRSVLSWQLRRLWGVWRRPGGCACWCALRSAGCSRQRPPRARLGSAPRSPSTGLSVARPPSRPVRLTSTFSSATRFIVHI